MANGGGGTVLFGIRESDDDFPIPVELMPLDSFRTVGVLEDVVRSGVRPPLLMNLRVIEADGGYYLITDVEQSPLGPYMVEAYGERRYYTRMGSRTVPMSEQQVRDAYVLAARLRERRRVVWDEHHLPIELPEIDGVWVAVAAVPEEPLRDILDVGVVDPSALSPPGPIDKHLGAIGLRGAVQQLGRWADGLFGDNRYGNDRPPTVIARLHRDGAVGMAYQVHTTLSAILAARVLNAQLVYAGWFWQHCNLRRPVELEARLERLNGATLDVGSMFGDHEAVREPTGMRIERVIQSEHLLPQDLVVARERHRIVRRFADRIYQAFGLAHAVPLFRTGQLYGRTGGWLGFSVAGAGIWNEEGRAVARVYQDGAILSHAGETIAHWDEGVLMDTNGDALGVLEMAPGVGCPDDFLAVRMRDDPRARVPGGNPGPPLETTETSSTPTPTRHWSQKSLGDLLAPSAG